MTRPFTHPIGSHAVERQEVLTELDYSVQTYDQGWHYPPTKTPEVWMRDGPGLQKIRPCGTRLEIPIEIAVTIQDPVEFYEKLALTISVYAFNFKLHIALDDHLHSDVLHRYSTSPFEIVELCRCQSMCSMSEISVPPGNYIYSNPSDQQVILRATSHALDPDHSPPGAPPRSTYRRDRLPKAYRRIFMYRPTYPSASLTQESTRTAFMCCKIYHALSTHLYSSIATAYRDFFITSSGFRCVENRYIYSSGQGKVPRFIFWRERP